MKNRGSWLNFCARKKKGSSEYFLGGGAVSACTFSSISSQEEELYDSSPNETVFWLSAQKLSGEWACL
ncbi:hypothetical protein S245_002727 [Arachis hypogaea]